MPILWLALTLGVWLAAIEIQKRSGNRVMANPVLLTIVAIGALLLACHIPYATYWQGAQAINLLLGPATIALAVPMVRHIARIGKSLRGMGLALLAGSLTSMVSAMALVAALGGSRSVMLSMAPKAATTPIAMGVAAQVGGIPALTAALAIAGGILAALIGKTLLSALGIEDRAIHGFSAGVAGSGIAVAQVTRLGEVATAFGALGIALNGVMTSVLLPCVLAVFP
jgi:putative effector of murein hydrolase